MRLYVGLVHFPVYNKHHEIIASAITTLDLHDIARAARTYDVKKLFVMTPLDDQRALAEQVLRHWTSGHGARYNLFRKEAMGLIEVVSCLDDTIDDIAEAEGQRPLLIATDASAQKNRSISYEDVRGLLEDGTPPVLLVFGTAWGLARDVMNRADHVLNPIWGRTDYNHLSVRSAAAIILDRLAGR
ncbi:MAG: RNA methyltransferase [Desulfatiglans sp.]|jgi:hypothetical protein|nr:RNA methyltransferase [Thermodesulfobacteriota bacterium]MEE4352043.1 RNA methyltransferase [Desulfatiglans sp.]